MKYLYTANQGNFVGLIFCPIIETILLTNYILLVTDKSNVVW